MQERKFRSVMFFVNSPLASISRITVFRESWLTSSSQTLGVSRGDSRASSNVPRRPLLRNVVPAVGTIGRLRFFGGACEFLLVTLVRHGSISMQLSKTSRDRCMMRFDLIGAPIVYSRIRLNIQTGMKVIRTT